MELLYLFFIIISIIIGFLLAIFVYFLSPYTFNILFKIILLIFIFTFFLAFTLLIKNTYLVSEYNYNQKEQDLKIPLEKVILFSKDNTMISAWILKYHSNSPTIILSHGFEGSKLNVLNVAKNLYKNGYNCLLFDFRAHGESKGKITTFGYREQEDLKAAINYILDNSLIKNKNLGLYGISMGAAISILVSEEYEEIKAIVADSSYPTLQEALERYFELLYHIPNWVIRYPIRLAYILRFFRDPKDISCLKRVEDIHNKAIFFINGENDIRTPPIYAKRLYEKANGPKKLWIIPYAEHRRKTLFSDEVYINKVVSFFNRYLSREPLWKKSSE